MATATAIPATPSTWVRRYWARIAAIVLAIAL